MNYETLVGTLRLTSLGEYWFEVEGGETIEVEFASKNQAALVPINRRIALSLITGNTKRRLVTAQDPCWQYLPQFSEDRDPSRVHVLMAWLVPTNKPEDYFERAKRDGKEYAKVTENYLRWNGRGGGGRRKLDVRVEFVCFRSDADCNPPFFGTDAIREHMEANPIEGFDYNYQQAII